MDTKRKVLILGGSEFMGRHFVLSLLPNPDYSVYIVNRGKFYWNTDMKAIPEVHFFFGDRNNYLEFQKLLAYISEKAGVTSDSRWDMVVDYSCYERKQMKCAIRGLKSLCKLYVYISTDSVYDVCDRKIRREDFIREEYAVRPENDTLIEELNKQDEYGNDKLRCEEYLRSHEHELGFPYINLRLPDVIGPFDSSGRFWAYLIWLKSNKDHPIHLNKNFEIRNLSFVFSQDVSKILFQLLDRIKHNPDAASWLSKINGESFNLAFEEKISLKAFIEKIAGMIGVDKVNFIDEKKLVKAGKFFYPSVECGPLNISKAKTQLGFVPSKLDDALRETCEFFDKANDVYFAEFKKAHEKFLKAIAIARAE
jgi:nucleoside-diphosphate-sugar epimerase